ncbi:helix-turn-helix domain-containing protein [Geodermatophilus sp. YIM 151500]|uniref:helix-turn-helix domain-containing protein n=1 Tax=Geodermatophilus sp. YIM 151500 TaxID=2984531 RepID=UPI0021E36492|nr:helix-turn-helix domain-containing protein [Geodermatophilus sp. YIM 151500]MCV2490979.1 helix-turn-helix domain-containing protein [Geodermatophilus sp. YIM 151500]
MDLRERVVAAVDAGMRPGEAAARFDVSVRTVERYVARRRGTGSLAPTAQRHGSVPEKKNRVQSWLPARLRQAADATLAEHAAAVAVAIAERRGGVDGDDVAIAGHLAGR